MKIRNLLAAGAAAIALVGTTVPAVAQPVSGQVTIGVGTPAYGYNTYNDWNRNGIDDRYENSYGYNGYSSYPGYGYPAYSYNNATTGVALGALAGALLSIPFNSHSNYAGTCSYNKVQLDLNNVRYNGGRIIMARDFGMNGLHAGDRLVGKSFWPTSGRVCVNARDISYGRVALVHDVNNNGIFDFQDGIGRVAYGAVGYGGRQTVRVNFAYGLNF